MLKIFTLIAKAESLFIRLLVSFLVVVILLGAINYWAFSLYRNNIRNEIIGYNTANLDNTTESFEKHFRLIYQQVLSFYFNDKVQLLNKKTINYRIADEVRREIQPVVSNPLLYMEDMVLYFKTNFFILDKNGSTRAETMFNKFYRSADYPLSFWQQESVSKDAFRIFPASEFSELVFPSLPPLPIGKLIPVIVKSNFYPDLYIIAFINARKIVDAYNLSIYTNFYIMDHDGAQVFASNGDLERGLFGRLDSDRSYLMHGNNYYFFKKGRFSGLTYVHVIPDESISSQISSLNATLFTLLAAAVVISVLVSVYFSMKIHNPVKEIIRSVEHYHPGKPLRSGIREFKVLDEKMRHIVNTNLVIHEDLEKKNSLLRYYAYINKFKNIYSNHLVDLHDLFVEDKPYVVVLFHIRFKRTFQHEMQFDTQRYNFFVKEYVDETISERFSNASTFQIEFDQILSLVYRENGEGHLTDTLEQIRQVLNRDRAYMLVTIAVSAQYRHSSDFTNAYDQAVGLIKQRSFLDEAQIVGMSDIQTDSFVVSSAEEQEFEIYLRAGNAPALLQWLNRMLEQFRKRKISAWEHKQFAEQTVQKVKKAVLSANPESRFDPQSKESLTALSECYNQEQLMRYLEKLLTAAAEVIKAKREEHDPIASFVTDYIERRFAEEITLEGVAEKLNITGGYLSTYFKEKTGKNFSDYVHEVRIGKAKEYLLQPNIKIQEVAAKAGYQNINSFNRMFKKFTGVTPSEFRQTKHGA